ncbi:MAG: hypothetical protein A3C85_02290 [Candidatus Doudnabacteria bacterium RIFCSPHIGHO2_02_FULL_48_21]|uniref:histidine kinase n=1 Tax=Candidatus Doudnabacteria bacterium RIFCSPLOWO2_02_FULL_48_13 TaxID=1817845 RepID=A0A1F5QC44_9BACT|nr:MAG: hypothetical protein A3K05_04490 [Candidatus Doudnabacteria bacterium RIFCSPHIGHO2_01_48_18]OGE79957.1 MAG: hypothetical protein A2668_01990 [Candidatus Doudnabacteria bacterium RIFCSPHIGHO2_01_FULL_48_180]OGE90974.1 MAG: hypothetical protein A3F44_02665 [Candidatus Doudnabacteria bacterium RIFCSPHIGHO2_12_FULL_47_25]OGE93453.1 MAG: hypothetical protein A3C85_02290 [Candidatus Doudnabacteria bacterium RIFCSPHIGHO2_02_FULL_48_21]OGE99462.1 MAG: hypothetical protein A3J05_03950 [Candidatu
MIYFDIPSDPIFWAAIFSLLVLAAAWFEFRRLYAKLVDREEMMRRRMYELSILRELEERIGYSLNVQKIVDVISSSLGTLLPYSMVVYMLPLESGRLLYHVNLAEPVSKAFIADARSRMLKSFSTLFGKKYSDSDIDETITGVVTDPTNIGKVESFFNIPIVINNRPAGIFTVASTQPGLYRTSQEVEILYTIMNQASEAISKLETVLEVEKGKLNSMVSSMADGVLMVDPANRVIVVNPQTRNLLGIKTENPTIFDVLDKLSDHLDLRTKIEESVRRDQVIVEDEVAINGHFVQILISPVKDNKNDAIGSVVLFHDITHEKELEKMREDFTSMMVHELRSPLTGIRSIADLLKNDKIKKEQKKYQEFVNLISVNSNSMLDLVNDLLDVAKIESGKLQVFKRPGNIKEIIKQRAQSFRTLAAEFRVEIIENIFPEVPEVLSFDDMKITQVFNNILSNAIKFTPPDGKITICAFVCKQNDDLADYVAKLKLPWQVISKGNVCSGEELIISISDTGMGIPQAEMKRLFNKFQQLSTAAKTEKKGTGLGLVIVKGIVEAHGGSINVVSAEGKGTTFYFSLPLTEEKVPQIVKV